MPNFWDLGMASKRIKESAKKTAIQIIRIMLLYK